MDEDLARSLLVKDEIRNQVRELIAEKWRLLKAFIGIAATLGSILVAAFGITQYISLQDVRKAAADAKAAAAAANASAQSAVEKVTTAAGLVTNARTTLERSMDELHATDQLLIQSRGQMAAVADSVLKAGLDARRAAATTASLETSIRQSYEAVASAHQAVVKDAGEVATKYHELIEKHGGLTTLDQLNTTLTTVNLELARLRASETAILRPGQTSDISLPDPENPTSIARYVVRIQAFDARKDIGLVFSVRAPGAADYLTGRRRTALYHTTRRAGDKQILPICGSPFECVVEYVGQGILIDDYVILRIRSSSHQDC